MDIISAATLLFLVMDPLGNIPVFLSVLDKVAPERRTRVLVRELLLALIVLVDIFRQFVHDLRVCFAMATASAARSVII